MFQRTFVAMALAVTTGVAAPGCQLDDMGDDAFKAGPGLARTTCVSKTAPTLLSSTATERVYRFTEEVDALTFSESHVDTPRYDTYLEFLEDLAIDRGVDVFDQRALLERQRDIFVEFLGPEEGVLFDLILDGEVGELSEVHCLESLLVDLQNKDFPIVNKPTETGALVLTRRTGGKDFIRVYVITQDGKLSVSFRNVLPRVRTDVAAGWSVFAHFHSHPFAPDNSIDIAGTAIPSSADGNSYRQMRDEFGLQEAWLTNGVDSNRILAEDFDLLD
jgi:hypothetical protein